MSKISIALLLVVGLMTLATTPAIYPHAGQAPISIQPLDVCHGSATGINVDMPCFIDGLCCNLLPPLIVTVRKIFDTPFKPLLIAFQDERPPQI